MISCRGKPLTVETKKLVVTVKQYFERNKFKPNEPSVKRTADALGIGVATVKRIMADYNRDPNLLDEPAKMRGRPVHALDASYQPFQGDNPLILLVMFFMPSTQYFNIQITLQFKDKTIK